MWWWWRYNDCGSEIGADGEGNDSHGDFNGGDVDSKVDWDNDVNGGGNSNNKMVLMMVILILMVVII